MLLNNKYLVERMNSDINMTLRFCDSALLTLNPLTWKIWWASNKASRWQMGINSAFKGL